MTRAARAGRQALEFGLPFVTALAVLPFVIQLGTGWPWHPASVDLQVYMAAAKDYIHGHSIYDTVTPGWKLKFIYPPIAAVFMLPMVFGPQAMWSVIWTALLVAAQQLVLRRCGIPRGWPLALLGAVVVVAMEPIRTTLGYGQVNTLLMAMVVADFLPAHPERRSRIPRGILLGLAAAIKLTPLLFVVFALVTRKFRLALTAVVSLVAWMVIGAIAMPGETGRYVHAVVGGQTNPTSPYYVGNQSMMGAVTRLAGAGKPVVIVAVLLGMLVAGIGTLAAAYWWKTAPVLALGVVGLCTAIASPLSWTHHHVWALVLLAAVLIREPMPAWLRWAATAWALWLSAALCLAVLPYGQGVERRYDVLQQVIANASPLGGSAVVIAMAVVAAREWWRGRRLSRA